MLGRRMFGLCERVRRSLLALGGLGLSLGVLVGGGIARAAAPIAVPAPWLRVGWQPASGPVAGYAVFVERDGRPFELEQWVAQPSASVVAGYGETIRIQVAAYDDTGLLGPASPPSSPFAFVSPLADPDADGWTSFQDLCPLAPDPAQGDRDGDGVGDACDRCPDAWDPSQADADEDGFGDACECGDLSGDGRLSSTDARLLQLCLAGAIQDTALCSGLCDVTGDDLCTGSDVRVIQRVTGGEIPKADLRCAERP